MSILHNPCLAQPARLVLPSWGTSWALRFCGRAEADDAQRLKLGLCKPQKVKGYLLSP